ncbi:hypothetical protein GCM10009792_14960 [Microcella alkalica]|uniref:Uncharacterized protein n=1 Tax=Microcella alkalica TaxID=355930 RepID=A0A839ECY3_9MICO|nr:hypothetical protein [Microcella alkalica]
MRAAGADGAPDTDEAPVTEEVSRGFVESMTDDYWQLSHCSMSIGSTGTA